ncbi:MAG: hypothetical protein HW378_4096 [Anaerolineales bacterium]|nr:hypothetical protein [Anaerolineales bacterium]
MRSALAPIANLIAKLIALILAVLFVATAVIALPLFNIGLHEAVREIGRNPAGDEGHVSEFPSCVISTP